MFSEVFVRLTDSLVFIAFCYTIIRDHWNSLSKYWPCMLYFLSVNSICLEENLMDKISFDTVWCHLNGEKITAAFGLEPGTFHTTMTNVIPCSEAFSIFFTIF